MCLVALAEMWHSLLGSQNSTLQHRVFLTYKSPLLETNHTEALVLTEEDDLELKLNLPTGGTQKHTNRTTIEHTSQRLCAVKCCSWLLDEPYLFLLSLLILTNYADNTRRPLDQSKFRRFKYKLSYLIHSPP